MSSIYRSAWAVCLAALSSLWFPVQGQAQTVVSITYLEGQTPAAPDAIATYGSDMFGDRASLYGGSLEFSHTDLVLQVSPTAVMEPPMFGVLEPATGG